MPKVVMNMDDVLHERIVQYGKSAGMNKTATIAMLCNLGLMQVNAPTLIEQLQRIVVQTRKEE